MCTGPNVDVVTFDIVKLTFKGALNNPFHFFSPEKELAVSRVGCPFHFGLGSITFGHAGDTCVNTVG